MSHSAHDRDVRVIIDYAIAMIDVVTARRRELDVRLERLGDAREDAEQAMEALHAACEMAERYAAFAARAKEGSADEIAIINAAHAIRALVGERSAA